MDQVEEPSGVADRIEFAHQAATRIVFLLAGVCVSLWAALIPLAKARLNISDGRLGLVLLCGGIGSVSVMPVAGAVAGWYGCRRVIVVAGTVALCALPFLAIAQSWNQLAALLFTFGAACGTLDSTMNIHAVLVERESGRAMMSSFHGLWSVGGIVGAGSVSLLIWLGMSAPIATVLFVAIALITLFATSSSLLTVGADRGGPAFVWPHGSVLLLGAFCCVLFLAEGSVLDWSGVFLSNIRSVKVTYAAAGYVAFSAAMTICRLVGDSIVQHLGSRRVVLLGGLCAAAGLVLAVAVPFASIAIVGFCLVGVGLANTVPVMFSAAGRQTSMPTNLAIPAMTTLAYAGNLAGPASIGFLAAYFGLSTGLVVIALLLASVSLISTRANL